MSYCIVVLIAATKLACGSVAQVSDRWRVRPAPATNVAALILARGELYLPAPLGRGQAEERRPEEQIPISHF